MGTDFDALSDLTIPFGQRPGTDRFLVDRAAMDAWFEAITAASDRLAMVPIGESTEGRPIWLLAISSADTIREIDDVRASRATLGDASLLADRAEDDGTLAGDKPVILITAGIHATEVGGVQLMPELVLELVTSDEPRVRDILDRLVVLIVPSLNPDGMDLVYDWYMQTLGTASEGTDPPMLYHRYAGHDNNRDWYTHALAETRAVIDNVHRPWRPTCVLDLHQMGEFAPRYVLPPFIDPAEPHMHPLLVAQTNAIGSALAAAHVREGHAGVASGVMFDSYSPTRSYQSYHGGVRILAEAASAHIASPLTLEPGQLEIRRGFDQRRPGVHNPQPWTGGAWRLRDIMDYHLTTVHTLLDHAARHADELVRDQWTVLADDVRRDHQPIYAISPLKQQIDPRAARDLVEILQRGDVGVEIVQTPGEVEPPGTIIVRGRQPFGSYARALLDHTPYPATSGTPYDVTSHCLPIHMGVDVRALPANAVIESRPLASDDIRVFNPPSAADADRSRWLAVDHRSHASIRVVAQILRNGGEVHRLLRPHFDGGRLLQPGTWLITGDHALDAMSRASRETVRSWRIGRVEQGTVQLRLPRIGLYVPWREDAIDAGWLRLMLEHSSLPYRVLHDGVIRDGELRDVDVLLMADQEPDALLKGNDAKTYPDQYAGGLGNQGTASLLKWVTDGGHLVAIDGALRALAGPLGLPIRFPLASMPDDLVAIPGSVVKIVPDTAHPLMLGVDEPFPAMMQGTNAFASRRQHDGMSFPAVFDPAKPLLSGWMRGEELLAGLGASLDHQLGSGHVVGFAFRPHFRTQMLASYAPLLNAIMRAGYTAGDDR